MKLNLVALLLLAALPRVIFAVEPVCDLRQPPLRVNRPDIFTDQQEQWLGDAEADMIEPNYTLVPASESVYLDRIGHRLLKQLPPTSIHYTFRIYESPDLRAFSLPGGHVYISRKLIMDARSEDELAAMLAQEIGRIYIHHAASAVTRRMEHVLHVKKLGDRADVYDDFERMLNLPADYDSFLTSDQQRNDELLADRVGIYAMIKAHYDPNAFTAFLDRVNDNGGYTGNLLTNFLDITPLVSLRVRTAHRIISALPAGCRQPRPMYRPEFKPFQLAIQQQHINPIVAATPGLECIALQQPIDPALENVHISADGKYILAQDANQIHVLTASPLKLLFSIPALGAEMAQFTPDSQGLVFHYNNLHSERWDLSTGEPTNILNFVDYAGCLQTSLSPDGNALACISQYYDSVWLKLYDIQTNQLLYQNLHFFNEGGWLGNANVHMTSTFQALMHWSRDGRYFVATSGTSAMAYDLKNRTTIRLGGSLSNLAQQRFAFVGSDKMLSTCDWAPKPGVVNVNFTMCYTTFPGGRILKQFQLPRGWIASIAGGESVLFGPMTEPAALVNPATARVEKEFEEEEVDARGNTWAAEVPDGGIGFTSSNGNAQHIALPPTPLTTVVASAFSPNGRYLALSNRARAAEWDLSTGRRLALTSPFRFVAVTNAGHLQAAFIPHELIPSGDPSLDRFIHRYVSWLSPLNDPMQLGTARIHIHPLSMWKTANYDVRMEASDARTEAHLWSRNFSGFLPTLVQADGDQMVMTTGRQNWTGGAKLTHTSDLPRQFINASGTVVEVIDNRTGKVEHALLTPQLPEPGEGDERSAQLFGNLLAVYGNHNDTTVYRVSDGARLFAFFGRALAGDDMLGMLAATNRIQELNIYDTRDGKRLGHYLLDQAVIAARFVPARKQLLVLTASQRVYRIDLSMLSLKGAAPPTTADEIQAGRLTGQ
jgi:hypothetical protein